MSTLDTTDTLRARYARAAPRLDPEGFRLFYAAQEIAGIPYLWEVFPYEDARGQFELANGHIQTREPLTPTNCPRSTSCAEDSPARHFLTLAKDGALLTPEALSSLKLPDWLKPGDLRICCLKMFPACSRMTRGGRLLSSSPRWMTWGIMSNGLCLTAPISTSPSHGNGCSLSAILIPDAPEKYFLSSEQTQKLLYKSSEGRRAPTSTTRKE